MKKSKKKFNTTEYTYYKYDPATKRDVPVKIVAGQNGVTEEYIYQPRRDNVCTWEIPLAELMEWAKNELIPKAQLAYNGEGEFKCGDWCQFCKAATLCRARADENLS